ncbi:DEAD/DEAH box helicase [Methylobacillus methanolivorans]|uniref:DNA 3'-5' helicase II n=1 Tax=Methylobacillus methanolivorans TaxID=1848927 RepID=A0ABW8GIS8_9PROT
MEKVVSSARLKDDPVCRRIIDFLSQHTQRLELTNSILYYDFPLFRDYEDELYQPSLLLLDQKKGVVVIGKVDTAFDLPRSDFLLGEFYSLLFSKFLNSRQLRSSRTSLKFSPNVFLFLPGDDAGNIATENRVLSSLESLEAQLNELPDANLSEDDVKEIRSVIEGVKALTKATPRDVASDGSKPKALVLKALEDEIANFDAHQRQAALTVALGPQRIRGLAGSGKTIVLAWKAAHILLTNPDAKILFTFYTKSLYDLIRKQITRFYRHFKDSDPNWDNLHVLHAWGGTREAGVYYNSCIEHGVTPAKFSKNSPVSFKSICEDLLNKSPIKEKYDVVLVDEAQDLPESFFILLFYLARGGRDEKTIIWAYDEFQSIFEPRMRTPDELFGIDSDGQPRINLDRSAQSLGLSPYINNDQILYKCYRNPLDVLVCSHAVGLGIYGSQIVQMLQDKDHWSDMGYEVIEGDFTTGSRTVIKRPENNSPLSILQHETKGELIKWFLTDNFSLELDWIVQETQLLIQGGLLPDDILIISLDDRNAKTYFEGLSRRFSELGISTHNLSNNPFSSTQFKMEGRITLSTVHKAKGNEAAVVFATGIDALAFDLRGRKARNRIFTAFTRTKCWLRISGLTIAQGILNEINQALSNSPHLVFEWPDLRQVETIQRDMSSRQSKAKEFREKYLKAMADLGISEEEALSTFETTEKSE